MEETMIKSNWHTHTARCGHAVGTDEEYVQAAIEAGMRTLGFSDHAPYRKPHPHQRMNFEMYPEYKASILSLREKYKDQIDIHLGMEVEYYESEWEDLKTYRKEMEYCILGQHTVYFEEISVYGIDNPHDLNLYTDMIEEGCRRGLCDYIAHPDVVMWAYPRIDDTVRTAAKRIAEIAKRYDLPVELNCGSGVKYPKKLYEDGERWAYPVRIFFEEFAKQKCPVIIGLDVHDPTLFLMDVFLERALSVIEGLDCIILDDYDLISAAAKRKREFGFT